MLTPDLLVILLVQVLMPMFIPALMLMTGSLLMTPTMLMLVLPAPVVKIRGQLT